MKNVLIILIFVSIIVVSSGCDLIEVTINGGDVNNENEYEDGEI